MTLHSITATYPGFQALPKGVKQMLLVSESVFFEETRVVQKDTRTGHLPPQVSPAHKDVLHLAPPGGVLGPRTAFQAR